jgi:co-chaperonin GroES (HSP10)
MIEAPENKLIVYPKVKYVKNITDLMRRSAIQNGASVDPTDVVNIVGEVVSIPKTISKTKDYEGYTTSNIKIGDVAIFSYKVIYDLIIKQENGNPVYRNMLSYQGKELFSCDIRNLFGVIRDGEIIMLNGYVMLADFELPKIIVSASLRKQKNTTKSEILYIGDSKTHLEPINMKQGDIAVFDGGKAAHYQINDKKFVILQQDRVLGKEIS